ncbi:type II secretion system F family protein [Ferroacidibacillus organovorans]|uniref:Type II secretion system protein GspF domain-containing protein n=1 Tax=Ferroacidibacillus organovorans TaxID=1765683 RepID=A0A101XSJ5_9BACL|nr:type II secretion system F family protein [Ferroacidibacillus organovorans]KUO96759.1 hypothetical protein ATW55_08025 [Ferroacidibacillus organovorans]
MLFTDLRDLLEAGLDIQFSLHIMRESVSDPQLKSWIEFIHEGLLSGVTLSSRCDALGFPAIYIVMIQSGEVIGDLVEALELCSAYLIRRRVMRERFQKLTLYPAFLFLMTLTVMETMSLTVIPNLRRMSDALHIENSSSYVWYDFFGFFAIYLPISLGAVGILSVLIVWKRKWFFPRIVHFFLRKKTTRMFTQLVLSSPGLDMLTFLLRGGTDVLHALQVIGDLDSLNTGKWCRMISRDLEQGISFSESLKKIDRMPAHVAIIMAHAESTGLFAESFQRASDSVSRMLERHVERIAKWAEPILIFFLGGMVMVSTLMFLIPMLSLVRQMS